jgi:acetyl esterase/lipase
MIVALLLWTAGIPGPVGDDPKNVPQISLHLAPVTKANGTGVIVIPGGGYSGRATDHEGKQIAEWLNKRGVSAFILKYRTVNEMKIKPPLAPGPMLDVQRAIRMVRFNAKNYGVDPKRIGVWGFSAGGHVASTAATHFDNGKDDGDEIDKVSCRPDFAILCYPVITMTAKTHGGSRDNLLGKNPDPKLIDFYSNEKHVTKETPPIFLFHTIEDQAVPIENSYMFKKACEKAGVPVKMAKYEKGRHGVGLAQKDPILSKWPEELEAWMKARGLLPRKD